MATSLTYSSVGDTNGLFYRLGTQQDSAASIAYINPLYHGNVDVRVDTWSSVSNLPSQIADRDGTPAGGTRYISDNVANQFILFCLPGEMRLDGYTVVNSFDGQNALRNWDVEGSNDNGSTWTLLDTHTSDSTLSGAGASAYFSVTEEETGYYQWIRLTQTGLNSHTNDYLVIDELELYGSWDSIEDLNPVPAGMVDCRWRNNNTPSSDTGGIFYHIGSEGGASAYVNPVDESGTAVTASDQDGGTVTERVADHDLNTSGGRWGDWSNSNNDPWIKFDFDDGGGEKVILSGFSYYPGYDLNHVWEEGDIQGSNDDSAWTDLLVYDGSGEQKQWGAHTDDITSYFSVDDISDSTQYRYIRFRQTGPNRAGNYYFTANHIEFYGAYGFEDDGQNVDPTSISSDESVSSPQVNMTVPVDSITSDEDVSSPSMAFDQVAEPDSVASSESVSNPSISLTTGVGVDSVDSEESVSSPTVSPGAVSVSPTSISSEESVENPTAGTTTSVSVDSVDSEESVSNVSSVDLTIPSITSIDSEESVSDPTVSAVAIVEPISIASDESVESPQVGQTTSISVDSIDSEEAVSDVAMVYPQIVEPTSISSEESVGTIATAIPVAVGSISSAEAVSDVAGVSIASNPALVLRVAIGVTTETVTRTVKRTTIQTTNYTATRTD